MRLNKDDAINIVGLGKFLFFDDYDRYCAKCGTKLSYYYSGNCYYLVSCKECCTRTIVLAQNPEEALDKVGVK